MAYKPSNSIIITFKKYVCHLHNLEQRLEGKKFLERNKFFLLEITGDIFKFTFLKFLKLHVLLSLSKKSCL